LPNIKSVIKDVKKSRQRRLRNLSWKSKIKTFIKKTRAAFGTEKAPELISATASVIDSAAQKGIIHKNAAARRKSRLMKQANKAASQQDQ
jgi:small subunit ribosomal protein S20